MKTSAKPEHWTKFETQMLENRKSIIETGAEYDESNVPGIIVIGRTGPYRNFENRKALSNSYSRYLKNQEDYQSGVPILTYREFEKAFDGWTTIAFSTIPMVGSFSVDAFVRKGESETIGFSSVAGAILVGSKEDLVAAQLNMDAPYYVIDKLLCKDGKGYRDCVKQFDLGRFDSLSGKELNLKHALKDKGKTIDTQTYKVIP